MALALAKFGGPHADLCDFFESSIYVGMKFVFWERDINLDFV